MSFIFTHHSGYRQQTVRVAGALVALTLLCCPVTDSVAGDYACLPAHGLYMACAWPVYGVCAVLLLALSAPLGVKSDAAQLMSDMLCVDA